MGGVFCKKVDLSPWPVGRGPALGAYFLFYILLIWGCIRPQRTLLPTDLKFPTLRFQIKYTEAILSSSTRQLLWFEITKIPIAVQETKNYTVVCYNFGHTVVPLNLTGLR